MRVRHIIIIGGITFAVGTAIWLYDNLGNSAATGAGGLPLITANTNPIRTEPDDPGGEVIPHADSTIFAAMSRNHNADPSMEGLKLPAPAVTTDETVDAPTHSPEFAGLKTGFALPTAPQPKVESLFTTDEPETAPVPAKGTSRFVGGIAELKAEDVEETVEITPEPEPAPIVEKPVEQPKQAVVEEPKAETPKAQPDQAGLAARVMEEQEKQVLTSLIPAPAEKPAVKPQPKAEPKKPDVKAEPKPVTTPEPITRPVATAPAAQPTSDNGYVIQLSSMPTRAEAERSWLQFTSMYPEALRGLSPSYVEATIPGRGTFTRLRAGITTRTDANARCEQIRREDPKAGGCLVIRN